MDNTHRELDEKIDLCRLRTEFGREEELVKRYVMKKELSRPNTNVGTILIVLAVYLVLSFVLSKCVLFLFGEFKNFWIVCIMIYVIDFFLFLKTICIKLVECYQHFAKESTRRKCLCKPTCSEYAIAVLKKYCVFVALYKIWKRLFRTCCGVYKIDLP